MFKQDLTFTAPYLNAAGTLGFAPDYRAPLPWERLGAFITNPLSLRPRRPAQNPVLMEYPGGYLLHTGLPNPGLPAAIKRYARRWADSRLPIIVHLMADRPDETMHMVQSLERLENIAAVELGFAPLLADDIPLLTLELSLGELPLIINLPVEKALGLGARAVEAGAAAISLAPPRGLLVTGGGGRIAGRLEGPALFPQAYLAVSQAIKANLPIIGGVGVGNQEKADAMLAAGALAVQWDTSLWKPMAIP